jgi:hypothetical protein
MKPARSAGEIKVDITFLGHPLYCAFPKILSIALHIVAKAIIESKISSN